jgi:hypothetical protein
MILRGIMHQYGLTTRCDLTQIRDVRWESNIDRYSVTSEDEAWFAKDSTVRVLENQVSNITVTYSIWRGPMRVGWNTVR